MPVAIITGASKGLGRALAAALAGRGWDLVLDARSAATLRAAAGESRGPGRVVALPWDVTDPGHRTELVAPAAESGGLDPLVNNASALGAEPPARLDALSTEGLRGALETNVVAPLALTRAVLPLLRASGGAVLNVSSDAAVEAYPAWGGYGASKAALEQLSAVLAVEEPRVRVWWVDPGDMRTDLYAAAVPEDPCAADRPAPESVVPALLRQLDECADSGRYTAAALLAVRR
ncbi:SDR family NAD(P)-dependent oxidoreductase [Streptantibioticus ferralitis]|uniref:SDR family NAD(P)-dependent oxidoreductase n=1 Tax=Streptantibioticus ferralitis TaxID=236510 RepID=A0ABT5YZ62_9ACTN|nr:SDR family oxidoreductase [Streptantibioticus ferralitis]MDF2256855.1 SDR family NAD(P)-dependent oxidoreductase [Streptantibioticus ferralitis]